MRDYHSQVLANYVLQETAKTSGEEFKLTVFILTMFLVLKTNKFYVYLNELTDGIDIFQSGKRQEIFRGLGLTRKQIFQAINQVNQRGIIKFKTSAGSLFKIKFNPNYLKQINQNATSVI